MAATDPSLAGYQPRPEPGGTPNVRFCADRQLCHGDHINIHIGGAGGVQDSPVRINSVDVAVQADRIGAPSRYWGADLRFLAAD